MFGSGTEVNDGQSRKGRPSTHTGRSVRSKRMADYARSGPICPRPRMATDLGGMGSSAPRTGDGIIPTLIWQHFAVAQHRKRGIRGWDRWESDGRRLHLKILLVPYSAQVPRCSEIVRVVRKLGRAAQRRKLLKAAAAATLTAGAAPRLGRADCANTLVFVGVADLPVLDRVVARRSRPGTTPISCSTPSTASTPSGRRSRRCWRAIRSRQRIDLDPQTAGRAAPPRQRTGAGARCRREHPPVRAARQLCQRADGGDHRTFCA
jgi:hypothetical protein